MKTLTLLAATALLVHTASAITADALAEFLGVASWSTTIDLPVDSFTVGIFEIVDGEVGEAWLLDRDEVGKNPEAALMLVIGPQEGHYKLSMQHAGVASGVLTKIPLFEPLRATSLPAKIGAGDFILCGQTRQDPWHGLNEPGAYARGFLLRVRKKAPPEIEEAKAQRCLSNAKIIALACKLYALDHDGKFATKIEELVPDYVASRRYFASPLAPAPGEMGYELLGGQDSDAPSKVLVRGRFTTSDGRCSIVYVNQSGALEWR